MNAVCRSAHSINEEQICQQFKYNKTIANICSSTVVKKYNTIMIYTLVLHLYIAKCDVVNTQLTGRHFLMSLKEVFYAHQVWN